MPCAMHAALGLTPAALVPRCCTCRAAEEVVARICLSQEALNYMKE